MLLLLVSGYEVKVTHISTQSKDQKVRADISIIKQAFDAYAMQHGGDYPPSLDALVARDERGRRLLNQTTVPKDPWNEGYGYEPPTPSHPRPRVYTLDGDKSVGGIGDDDIDYQAIANGR